MPKPEEAEWHQWLEKEAEQYLESKGFLMCAAPYHAVCEKETRDRLQEVFTLDALHLRSRPDRMAVHKSLPIAFEWEVKSLWNRRQGPNFTIEALPLLHHIKRSELLDRGCLYVCYHPSYKCHFGFWACDVPPIQRVDIPSREEYQPIRNQLEKWFGVFNAPIKFKEKWKGSGDPYVLILKDVFCNLPHWKILIDNSITGG